MTKVVGDEVYSGTVNQYGTFDMRATKVGEDSSLQRMIRLVQSADADKAKIVHLADRWATWIVVIALLSAGATWLITGEIIRAVTILVVFCPCALVLATPTAIMAGIGNATKFGILIREGDALERLSMVKGIAFDKTGTLTYGKPDVAAVESFDSSLSGDELLSLTASAELRSEHPLGKAIVAHHKATQGRPLQEPQDFHMVPGRGVSAMIENQRILAGNEKMMNDNSITLSQQIIDKAEEYRKEGSIIIYIAIDDKVSGFIALADTLRSDVKNVINEIEKVQVKNVLITGDNKRAASHIAELVGITNIHSECLPENKLAVIEKYQNQGDLLCMVGDGVNDAPALKKAHVGIAMGGIGSDIAVDAADIVLVSDDIKVIPHLLALAKKTMKTIRLNLVLSMALNFAAILLAMVGILGPVMGALVHNVGSVAVILNSSLLLKWKENR